MQELEYVSDDTVEAMKTDNGVANEFTFFEYYELRNIEGEHYITWILNTLLKAFPKFVVK